MTKSGKILLWGMFIASTGILIYVIWNYVGNDSNDNNDVVTSVASTPKPAPLNAPGTGAPIDTMFLLSGSNNDFGSANPMTPNANALVDPFSFQ